MTRRYHSARHRSRVRDVPLDQPAERESVEVLQDGGADAAQHLENLRVALNIADPTLFVRLVRPRGGPPHLRVNNSVERGQFAEDIGVRTSSVPADADCYVWSWGEEITAVTTPETAAVRIRTVLAIRRQET